jgi:hypothetical protein
VTKLEQNMSHEVSSRSSATRLIQGGCHYTTLHSHPIALDTNKAPVGIEWLEGPQQRQMQAISRWATACYLYV